MMLKHFVRKLLKSFFFNELKNDFSLEALENTGLFYFEMKKRKIVERFKGIINFSNKKLTVNRYFSWEVITS